MKLTVIIEIEVEDSLVQDLPAAQENLTHYTLQAVQNRLFGAGFMPDDVEIDRWASHSFWGPNNHWAEDPNHSVEHWKYEVENDDTRLGYHQWVANQKEQADES